MAQGCTLEVEVGSLARGVLAVRALSGREALSEPYAFEIQASVPSGDPVEIESLLGAEAKIFVRGPGGTERIVHGQVERVLGGVAEGAPAFELRVVPRLARLARVSRSRIFQEMTVPAIVAEILDEHGVAHRAALSGSYVARTYAVQHQETDLAFVSRLLEEEGIGYLFEHRADGHELVLFDDRTAGPELPRALPRLRSSEGEGEEFVDRVLWSARLAPGAATLRDYDPENPAQDLAAGAGDGDLETYEYPGGYAAPGEGRRRAEVRLAQARGRAATREGVTNAVGLVPGATFEVEGTERLFCVSVLHEGKQDLRARATSVAAPYRSAFVAVPADAKWRPPRRTEQRRPPALQTATVVGPSGEEIHVDRQGRVKVRFHWDRAGCTEDRASCWIRLAQRWGGASMGTSFVPRVGQEVLVRFLDGDADRPLVVGAVYDGASRPPVPLPQEKTKSTQRTSTSPGGEGYNELRLEDAAGGEEVFLHAQKDLDLVVERDRAVDVRRAESLEVGKDLKHSIEGNRTISASRDASTDVLGNQVLTVTGAALEGIAGGEEVTVQGMRATTVASARTVNVRTASAETVGGAALLTVGGAYAVNVALAENVLVVGARLEQVIGAKVALVNGSHAETVEKTRSSKIAGGDEVDVGGNALIEVGKDATDDVGQALVVDVTAGWSEAAKGFALEADRLTVKVGGRVLLTLKKSGDVALPVANLTVKASSDIVLKGGKVKKEAGGSESGQGRSQQAAEGKGTLTVRFEVDPSDASRLEDEFVLESTDGSYRQQKTVKDDKKDGDDAVDIEFTDVPLDEKFRLKVVAGGNDMVLLDDAPFAEIAAMLIDQE